MSSKSPEVVVVIPAYQAESTIGSLVRSIGLQGLPVIVVNDASLDGTGERARAAGAQVLDRPVNGGKGRALRDGLTEALRNGYRWMVLMDADGQHLPEEIPRFLQARDREPSVELLLGNRMQDPKGMPLHRRVTNGLMSQWISRIAGRSVPDTQCGFRLVSRGLLERVTLISDCFEIDSELIIRSGWAGFRIASVPVACIYRRENSFIHPVADTVRFLRFLKRLLAERRP